MESFMYFKWLIFPGKPFSWTFMPAGSSYRELCMNIYFDLEHGKPVKGTYIYFFDLQDLFKSYVTLNLCFNLIRKTLKFVKNFKLSPNELLPQSTKNSTQITNFSPNKLSKSFASTELIHSTTFLQLCCLP